MITLKKDRLLSTTIVAGLAAVSAAAFLPSAAMAQTTTSQSDDDADQVEEVVVVGSRIAKDVYNSPSPIQVVTRDEATLAGLSSTTEILQGTAVTGGTSQINNLYGGYVVDGGPGANTLSLRGLGATRTLVLLNGRRVAPAGSRGSVGSADLNVLPSALIERIEILKDGASSIYGSDAVAGVVNVVTRDDLEGIELEAQYNATTDADGEGDESRVSISAGASGDRWHVIGSLERYNREELTLGARDFTRCPIAGFTDGSDYIDPRTGQSKCFSLDNGGVTVNTLGTGTRAGQGALGNVATFNRWRPNSAVTIGLTGFEGVGGGTSGYGTSVRDTFDPDMLNSSLFSPVEVTTAYLGGSYDLQALGNAEIYSETLLNRRESSQVDYRQLTLDYAVGSPLIPANIAAGNPFSVDQGLNRGQNVQARAFIGFGNYTSEQTVDFGKQLIGIRGDLGFRDWTYDGYVSYTKSRSEYIFPQFLTNLLIDSLDVVVAPAGTDSRLVRSGIGPAGTTVNVTCRVNTTDVSRACIPAPFLNTATIGGDLPTDWVNYVFRPVVGTTEYIEKVASFGVTGTVFTLPAGEVKAFLGAEYREASIDDTPGYDSQTGNTYNFSTASITRGDDSVTEVFGEIEVPLLADAPFANELTLTASGRYTDYDSYGDDTTYKVGLLYSPVSWASVRATYGTSYRAPALFEQFLGATSGFIGSGNDVCNEYDTGNGSPTFKANCASEVPAGFTATSSVRVLNAGGAAAGLSAETSTNFTGGIIIQPPLPTSAGDLSFAVDYYEIEVDNGVSQVGAGYILSQCYNSSSADFAARNGYCAFVSRDTSTRALTVTNGYVNIATDYLSGIDYNLRYRLDVGPGTFLGNVAVTQYLERHSQLFPTDPVYELVGTVNSPEFTATADVTYSWDKWRVRYGVEWINATSDKDYLIESTGFDYTQFGYDVSVDSYYLHSASVQYSVNDDLTLTAGVRNIFNEDPPTATGAYLGGPGNAPLYSGYDFIGRNVFVALNKSF